MGVRVCKSGKMALEYVIKHIMPLPPYSSITKEYSHFHSSPGFIRAGGQFVLQKTKDKTPFLRLCGILFDEG